MIGKCRTGVLGLQRAGRMRKILKFVDDCRCDILHESFYI